MGADFSGYATKAGLKCSDGRTITAEAFQNMDGQQVPLVWQHGHNDPKNVLGHAVLEKRSDGVYAYAYFNDSEPALQAKALVQHKDINSLSIYANQLVERGKQVLHGVIKEVSLVLSGANPGAKIDFVAVQHSDGDLEELEDEAIITTGLELEHEDKTGDVPPPAQADERTVQDVLDTLNEEQRSAVEYVLGIAIETATEEAAAAHSDDEGASTEGEEEPPPAAEPVTAAPDAAQAAEPVQSTAPESAEGASPEATSDTTDDEASAENNEDTLDHQEGSEGMKHNVFENNGGTKTDGPVLSHSDLESIFNDAQRTGSMKEAVEAYALAHSITDIDFLFPDAKNVTSQPDVISRRTEWVAKVMDGAKHSPFSRIKSMHADLTAEEARAKGYVKGNLKKEEIIKLLRRVTTPTTVYKKQALDRDDVVDITDFDVVAWLKWEMRFMLEEEVARAILIGDGREPDDDDKIDEDKVRPIAWDDEMYAHPVTVPANVSADGIVESVLRARKFYKGTGRPSFFTTDDILTDMILIKDKIGRRLYNTEVELAAALRVAEIVVVEPMEDFPDLLGVIVNMTDYTVGADRGGQISFFDDFDIDYNKQKYLIETRVSGALTKAKSAVVVKRTSGTTVTPLAPTFEPTTNTVTVPTVTGVSYFNVTDPLNEVELTDGADVVITETTDVEARPDTGYNFPHNTDADWTFAYVAP